MPECLSDGLAAEARSDLGAPTSALFQQQVVEMEYGAALALVAQPGALALAPGATAVDEVEYRCAVLLVEFLDFLKAGTRHLVVPRRI